MARDPANYWLLIILAYFGLHTVLRVVIGQPLTDLETHLTGVSAQFSWTYDDMLPAYPWLQFWMFSALGPGVLALALAKNTILVVLSAAIYLTVRLSAGKGWAWLSMLSLLSLPQIAWTAHHNMSDDLLAAAMAALTVLMLDLQRRSPNALAALGLGAVMGFGMLSAVGYWWFLGALLLAVCTVTGYRKALFAPMPVVVIVSVAASIAGLPLYMAGEGLAGSMQLSLWQGDGRPEAARYLHALFASAALLFVVVCTSLVTGYSKADDVDDAVVELRRLFARTAALGVVLILAGTLSGAINGVGQKEILPILIVLAPAAALFLSPTLSGRDRLRVTRIAGAAALVMLVANPIYHAWATKDGQTASVAISQPQEDRDGAL